MMPKVPVSRRRLEGDWFAMDRAGRVALFCGGDSGPIPNAADPAITLEALTAMDAAEETRREALRAGAAYRGSAYRQEEPIFDLPRGGGGLPLHEHPFDGYPHLVFAGRDGLAAELRLVSNDVETRDALTRDGEVALYFPSLGRVLYDAIHEQILCAGCRVLDLPDDPRLRAPETIAAHGLFVFMHPGALDEAIGDTYFRVVSPSTPADPQDLEPIVLRVAESVRLDCSFDEVTEIEIRPG